MYKKFFYWALICVVFCVSACKSTQIETVEVTYKPKRDETISISDSPCLAQAIDKAKTKYDTDTLVISNTDVSIQTDDDRRSLVVVCSIDVEVP